MRDKKAQAGMEFFMTYGWAILIVTVGLGALVKLGVFSPAKFLPETCSFAMELSCVGKSLVSVSDNTITFVLSNNVGYKITLLTAGTATSGDCTFSSVKYDDAEADLDVSHGEMATVQITCSNDIQEGRFKSDIFLPYTSSQSNMDHRLIGHIQSYAQ